MSTARPISPRPVSPRPHSPRPADTREAEQLLETLRDALHNKAAIFAAKHSSQAQTTLTKLKIELTKFNLYPPFDTDPAQARKELLIAREAYELGVLLSIHLKDVRSFQRNIAQLRPFYTDFVQLLPASGRQADITGLHLLSLLSNNQLADFHSELELLMHQDRQRSASASASASSSSAPLLSLPQLQYPIQLEQWLMEGCYHKVFSPSSPPPPLPDCELFLSSLLSTVRDKIADSAQAAYRSYPLHKAPHLLMYDDPKDADAFIAYVKQRGWEIKGDQLVLPQPSKHSTQVDQLDAIAQHLKYASELERIV